MTGLPKDLIASYKSKVAEHPDKQEELQRQRDSRFKDLMHSHQEKEAQTDEEEQALEGGVPPLPSPACILSSLLSTPSVLPCSIKEELWGPLFEKVASTLLIMTSKDERETTLFLDGPKFASSVFAGTRITVKEFSTAPRAFNIEIAAQQTALQLLTTHKDALMAAFERGKFPFTIHRLDTEVQVHRKERPAQLKRRTEKDEDEREET